MVAPLDGIRVVEFANFAAAPTAVAIMADLGAEVTKVETVGGDPIRGLMRQAKVPDDAPNPDHPFQFINRGKQSIELDLGQPQGVEVAHRLAAESDVVVLNMLRDRRRRFGIDIDDLHAVKPDLVIGLLSGYGERGEEINRPGYDVTAFFARSGLMSGMTMDGQVPPTPRPGQGDHTASLAFFGALMTGLRARDVSGEGQVVEASLLRSAAFTLGLDLGIAVVDGRGTRDKPREEGLSVMLQPYECADGRWLQFTMPGGGRDAWARFCTALERQDLIEDPRFTSGTLRYRNMAELVPEIADAVKQRSLAEWGPLLDAQRCIWAPVNSAADAAVDPQVRAAGVFEEIHHPDAGTFDTVAAPFRLIGNDDIGVRGPAPEVGEHSEQVLRRLGYGDDEIADLARSGVVPSAEG
ncbi:MAG: CoA transferase [Actinomycetota bacterium]